MTKSIIELAREAGAEAGVRSHMNALGDSIVFDPQELERFATLHRAAIEKEIEHKIFEAAKRHNLTLCKTADGYTLMQLGIVTAQGN